MILIDVHTLRPSINFFLTLWQICSYRQNTQVAVFILLYLYNITIASLVKYSYKTLINSNIEHQYKHIVNRAQGPGLLSKIRRGFPEHLFLHLNISCQFCHKEIVDSFPIIIWWGFWFQELVSQAGINNGTQQNTVRCNFVSLPKIPASGTKVLILFDSSRSVTLFCSGGA